MKKTAVKFLSIVLTFILACQLTACSENKEPANGSDSGSSNSSSSSSSSSPDKEEEKTPAEEQTPQSSSSTPDSQEDDATTPETEDPAPDNTTAETTPPIPDKSPETETTPLVTKEKEDAPSDGKALAPAEKANSIVGLAKSLAGNEFKFGGASPEDGFDNSGLIYYVLTQNGIACPRLTHEIARIGSKIGYDELQPGDLVFFCMENSGNPDFGGIYVGDGQMMISMSDGIPVKSVDITTNYYKTTFVHGIAVAR